jgi:hypothetical protein
MDKATFNGYRKTLSRNLVFPGWPTPIGRGQIMTRSFIVMVSLLLCSCATSLSQAPQLPKVQMEGKRLAEPDYGYSLEIPSGFALVDDTFLARLEPAQREKFLSELSSYSNIGLRAMFFNSSNSSFLMLMASRSIYATKQDAVNAGPRLWQSWVTAENTKSGKQEVFNIQINEYERLTDLNASVDTDQGLKMLAYYCPYYFKGSLREMWLLYASPIVNFEYHLPEFYSCVKSLQLTDQTPRSEGQGQKEAASVRLEKLKKLKDAGLISEQDYENKKRQILNEL